MSGKLCRLTRLASPFTLQSEAMAAARFPTTAGCRQQAAAARPGGGPVMAEDRVRAGVHPQRDDDGRVDDLTGHLQGQKIFTESTTFRRARRRPELDMALTCWPRGNCSSSPALPRMRRWSVCWPSPTSCASRGRFGLGWCWSGGSTPPRPGPARVPPPRRRSRHFRRRADRRGSACLAAAGPACARRAAAARTTGRPPPVRPHVRRRRTQSGREQHTVAGGPGRQRPPHHRLRLPSRKSLNMADPSTGASRRAGQGPIPTAYSPQHRHRPPSRSSSPNAVEGRVPRSARLPQLPRSRQPCSRGRLPPLF